MPFAAAWIYKLTGVQEWVGRLQSVLFFAVGLPFFFLIVRRVIGEVAAVWATLFYAFAPLSVVASRAFIPDMPSLSLAIIGIHFFLVWLEENRWVPFLASAVLISLALLIKITTGIIGVPLLYLAISAHQFPWRAVLRRGELWLFGLIALVPSAAWYWHAHHIAKTFYPYHFFGSGGVRIMSVDWYWNIVQQTVLSTLTPLLFGLAFVGAFVTPRRKYRWFFQWWFGIMVLFIFAVGWGNRHRWYQLPLAPIAAAFAGCGCQWIAAKMGSRRLAMVASAVLITAFGISSYWGSLPFYTPAAAGLRNLGLELKEATTPDALIVAADKGDPTAFYYAHRKGWHFPGDGLCEGAPSDSAQIIANLEMLKRRGATHFVLFADTIWWLEYYGEFAEHLKTTATLVEEKPEFTIYKLVASSEESGNSKLEYRKLVLSEVEWIRNKSESIK